MSVSLYTGLVATNTALGCINVLINLSAMHILWSKKRMPKSKSHFLYNLFIFNIAKIVLEVSVVSASKLSGAWIMGNKGCLFFLNAVDFFEIVAIITMMLMSVEKYLVVKFPFITLTSNKYKAMCATICSLVYAALLVCLKRFFRQGHVNAAVGVSATTATATATATAANSDILFSSSTVVSCTYSFLPREVTFVVAMCLWVLGGYVLPLCVMNLCYMLLFNSIGRNKQIDRQQRRQRRMALARPLHKSITLAKMDFDIEEHKSFELSVSRTRAAVELRNQSHQRQHGRKRGTQQNGQYKSHRRNALRHVNSEAGLLGIGLGVGVGAHPYQSEAQRAIHKEMCVARLVAFDIFVFCLSWLPYFVLAVLQMHSAQLVRVISTSELSSIAHKLSNIIIALNLIVNERRARSQLEAISQRQIDFSALYQHEYVSDAFSVTAASDHLGSSNLGV